MAAIAAPAGIYAKEWMARFRALYDEEAGDPRTALGLFYERSRRFVVVGGAGSSSPVEFTFEQWNRTFATFLASLAREFGLVQAESWTDVPQLMWYWHGVPDSPAVAIRQVNVAGESVAQQDVPSIVRSGALLTVLLLYPDLPEPRSAHTLEQATDLWRARVSEELSHLGLEREFLLATMSAFDWQLPSSWRGFEWRPSERAMSPVR